MRKNILISALAAFLLFVFSAPYAFAGGHSRIEGAELQQMIKSGTRMVVVDVREPELFAKAHVPNSINIPYEGAKKRILKELNPNDTIVFICHTGRMGDELAEILTSKGYKKVYNVIGGMAKWTGPTQAGKR